VAAAVVIALVVVMVVVGVGEAPAAVAGPLDLAVALQLLEAFIDPRLGAADCGGQLGELGTAGAGGAQAGCAACGRARPAGSAPWVAASCRLLAAGEVDLDPQEPGTAKVGRGDGAPALDGA
jgi:hypothetical protein